MTAGPADRDQTSRDFLAAARWGNALRRPLAGDASNRRYERLVQPDGSRAVLMDAPAERGEDLVPFLHIAAELIARGFSAPQVLAEDRAHGFLLLEDLGDDLFAAVLKQRPEAGPELYRAAVDVLIRLHEGPAPQGLAAYDARVMADLASLPLDWYAPSSAQTRAAFADLIARTCDRLAPGQEVMILRDYHAENLIWLPERDGAARVGLLDFQDAMSGHRAYDLISLTTDARRDVAPDLQEAMIAQYIAATGVDAAQFRAAAAMLATQRNLRIVGVFARLCLRDGKSHYLDFLPRVWGYLQQALRHPALAEVAAEVRRLLPEPTPDHLQPIRERCGCGPKAR